MDKEKFSLYLDKETSLKLKIFAAIKDKTRNEIIAEALKAWMRDHEKDLDVLKP